MYLCVSLSFFFNDTATTEIYTLSLHDALPISLEARARRVLAPIDAGSEVVARHARRRVSVCQATDVRAGTPPDRKSTRLNSSHANISYAVFCLKKKRTRPPPPVQ